MTSAPVSYPPLVLIHGLRRSGKGTVAARLIETHGYQPVKFASTLKDMVRVLLRRTCGLGDIDVERCIESDLKEVPVPALGGKSTRYTMQVIGTDYRDAVSSTMFSRITIKETRTIKAAGGRAVLDDLRFMHEIDVVHPEAPTLWSISSDQADRRAQARPTTLPWDPSATPELSVTPDVLDDMVRAMLTHCGLSDADIERSMSGHLADAPIAVLEGRSAAHCRRMLETVWLPLMRLPWDPDPVKLTVHIPEKKLPDEVFSTRIMNNGSLPELYEQVDAAVTRELTREPVSLGFPVI